MATEPLQPQVNQSAPFLTESPPVPPNPPADGSENAQKGAPSNTTPPKVAESMFSWKGLLRIAGLGTAVPALITAGVSVATMVTNCTTEQIKVDANHKDRKLQAAVATQAREEKLEQDERERRDINAAKRRELQTKYVDMALGRQLCLDYRVRVFGYLSTVLGNSEKAWAEAELRRAKDAQNHIDSLKKQLGEAQANLVSPTQNAIDQFKASGPVVENTSNLLAVFRRTSEQNIRSIQAQLADVKADDPPCNEPTAENRK